MKSQVRKAVGIPLSVLLVLGALVGLFTPGNASYPPEQRGSTAPQWALREFKHDDGRREIGRLRPDGTKEGLWQEFHANGWQASEGAFKDGKQEGMWTI